MNTVYTLFQNKTKTKTKICSGKQSVFYKLIKQNPLKYEIKGLG